MFEGKKIIKRKISTFILAIILLSLSTQVFAQQQDLIKENNPEKFLNELRNIQVITDIEKDISLYEISSEITIFEQVEIQPQVQKTSPEILWSVSALDLSDDDLHQWASAILGLYKPHPEKSDIREISILSYLNEPLNLQKIKFENARLIEAVLESEESLQNENPLMGLMWQINEDIDFAIVGQYQLDMAHPDFVEYLKNDDEDQTKGALYAKLTLRF